MTEQDKIETVGDLVAALLLRDQGARVGVCNSDATGWVSRVRGLCVAEDGTVAVDLDDRTWHAEEVGLTEVGAPRSYGGT